MQHQFQVRHSLDAAGRRRTGTVRPRERVSAVRLVQWVYREQKADIMSGKGLYDAEASADSGNGEVSYGQSCVAKCETAARLGDIIRSTGHMQNPALHPDAEIIHDIVCGMHWTRSNLLISHGRLGTVPEWNSAIQQLDPVEYRGEIVEDRVAEVVEIIKKNRSREQVTVKFCPVQPYPPDEVVEMHRGVYRTWFAGMLGLVRRLAMAPLVRWEVAGMGAVEEPWR